jgi:predicted Fe-Mo cluster-binding NifX family protein
LKKIALPVIHNNLCPQFEQCPYFKIYYIDNCTIIKKELVPVSLDKPDLLLNVLISKGITDIIVGRIERKAIQIFNQHKVHVFTGVEIEDPEILIQEFLNGTLKTSDNFYNK